MPRACNLEADTAILVQAARNMYKLTKATLSTSPITAHIISHVQFYTQLMELEIYDLTPEEYIWKPQPTSLVSLKWHYPTLCDRETYINTASLLLNVASTTCPRLKSLSMTSQEVNYMYNPTNLPVPGSTRYEAYETQLGQQRSPLKLHHFGFHYCDYDEEAGAIKPDIGLAIKMFPSSLTSLSIPINCEVYTNSTLSQLLRLGKTTPALKALILTHIFVKHEDEDEHPSDKIPAGEFYQSLTTGFNSLGISIEKFSTQGLGTSYSTKMGRVFANWKHLKWLQIGDDDNENDYYNSDGAFDLEDYSMVNLTLLHYLNPSCTLTKHQYSISCCS
jgi:hypothetical protein